MSVLDYFFSSIGLHECLGILPSILFKWQEILSLLGQKCSFNSSIKLNVSNHASSFLYCSALCCFVNQQTQLVKLCIKFYVLSLFCMSHWILNIIPQNINCGKRMEWLLSERSPTLILNRNQIEIFSGSQWKDKLAFYSTPTDEKLEEILRSGLQHSQDTT